MSGIRSVEQLYDKLSRELAWRRQELSSFKSLIEQRSLSESRRNVLLRSGVTLLYAHWEGFVKEAGQSYLEFVALKKLRHEDLAPNFIALSLKGMFNTAESSTKVKAYKDITEFFLNKLGTRCSLQYRSAINTKSNLSFEVLEEILESLGLETDDYSTKSKVIDEKLLNARNTIAHGEHMSISEDEYSELHELVLQMISTLRTQIDNAATLGKYRA